MNLSSLRRSRENRVALARVATALAFTSMAAVALGALAIGRIAIRSMAMRHGHIHRLEIEELIVGGVPWQAGGLRASSATQ